MEDVHGTGYGLDMGPDASFVFFKLLFFTFWVQSCSRDAASSLLCLEHLAGSVALSPSELNQIATEGQTCADFGIHARLPLLKELYDLGEAAFISNVGSLAAPVSKVQWESGAGERHSALGIWVHLFAESRLSRLCSTHEPHSHQNSGCAGLFSHSDQQQAAQTLTCQSAASASKGAGGRIAETWPQR